MSKIILIFNGSKKIWRTRCCNLHSFLKYFY